jgi:hypothetical protein
MEILAYGEDALTLWAMTNKLSAILQTLKDSSDPSNCRIFFRPSFGRSGGESSSQFGEFDFMLLAARNLYLGESKWQRSTEKIQDGILALRPEQILRHTLFKFYVEEWAFGNYSSWHEFESKARPKLQQEGIVKPIAPARSLLAANLQTVLGVIKKHYTDLPVVKNVLLFLHNDISIGSIPQKAGRDFEVVSVDYADAAFENLIRLNV